MIEVVNKRQHVGAGVYIGRPSPLGNPFSYLPSAAAQLRVKTRAEAIACYREWLEEQMQSDTPARREIDRLASKLLRKKKLVLVCWCKPAACHGDVIAEVVQREAEKLR